MPKGVSLNIRMWASKPDKVMEKIILSLGWEWYRSRKAYEYARYILKSRWFEAEKYIMLTPYNAYLYARHVIGGRWPEAEKSIAKEQNAAYLYAKYVLKDRFYLAEKKKGLFKHPQTVYLYAKYVIKGRWKEKEHILRESDYYNVEYAVDYSTKILKKRWPAIEHEVLKSTFIKKYTKTLKTEKDKEEFHNKLLAYSLIEPEHKYQRNHAKEYIKDQRPDEAIRLGL